MIPEFKSFGEIKQLSKMEFSITQKIHGSNAQVKIYQREDGEVHVLTGSRTRWITPGKTTDNYGFAEFVQKHRQEFIDKLGLGTHFGEWCGPSINSGEGLAERTFVLFDWRRTYPNGLPPQCKLVPVLCDASLSDVSVGQAIQEALSDLKENGSRLVPGFMKTEGIVVSINGTRFKKTFEAEETGWKKEGIKGPKTPKEPAKDYSHLLQPLRLEKLLSRDEQYRLGYPQSLPQIVKDYVADLLKEGQIAGTEDEIKAVTKGASSQIFQFIRASVAGGF